MDWIPEKKESVKAAEDNENDEDDDTSYILGPFGD